MLLHRCLQYTQLADGTDLTLVKYDSMFTKMSMNIITTFAVEAHFLKTFATRQLSIYCEIKENIDYINKTAI